MLGKLANRTSCALTRGGVAARLSAAHTRGVHIEARLEELGLTLPETAKPKGNYVPVTRSGNLLFTAGHLPINAQGETALGKVGADVSVEEGYEAAQSVALQLIATLKAELGDLDRVEKIVKLVGFVNCVDGFTQQPQVINGASDLIGSVFGDKGVHSRSAVGTNALPLGIPVEIEAIVEIKP